jgi:membrane-bound lytic murein transglycosylase D
VAFWESIFSKYKTNQCVIHDSKHLDRVLLTVNLPRKRKAKRLKIRQSVAKVKRALLSIAKNPRRKLSGFDAKISKRVSAKTQRASTYRSIATRVRCQTGLKDSMDLSYKLAKKHMPLIRRELKSMGMPRDLAYIPYLESGFQNMSRSKAGARGLWQLMPSKARESGLRVNRKIDERLNVPKATRVALKDLKKYRKITGTWGLTLTAHNYGINGVKRAMKKYKTNSYVTIRNRHRTRLFRFASRNFYPSFLAVRNVVKRKELAEKRSRKKSRLAQKKRKVRKKT